MITRRQLIAAAGGGAVVAGAGLSLPERFEAQAQGLNLPAALPEGVRANVIMDALPGKKPLIKLSYRPPNYETPIEYFRNAITTMRSTCATTSRTFPRSTSKLGKFTAAAMAPTLSSK